MNRGIYVVAACFLASPIISQAQNLRADIEQDYRGYLSPLFEHAVQRIKWHNTEHAIDLVTNGHLLNADKRRFILGCGVDRVMVKAIKQVSSVMGMKTVAEFVETKEGFDVLKEIGVDYVQGYWVEKPKPVSEVFRAAGNPDGCSLRVVTSH